MSELAAEVAAVVGKKNVLSGVELSQRSKHYLDTSPMDAALLLLPETTSQVSQLLAICHACGQSVVTQGGLTGLSGGDQATQSDVIISLERMSAIESLDALNNTMTVQAGCVLETIQSKAAEANRLFALDLGARGSCTIGGNIATNAGGLSVLRYGMMRDQVLGLEAVLADGTVVSSLNHMLKNNSGYDLKQLFIGSEGTLGVVTRAVLRLRPAVTTAQTALFAFEHFNQVTDTLELLGSNLGGQLSAYEVLWNNYYRVTTDDKRDSFAPPLDITYPYYAIAESTGNNVEQDAALFQRAIERAAESGAITDAVIAQSSTQASQIWEIRENVNAPMQDDPTFIFDISLPISTMEQYVNQLEQALLKRWPDLKFYCYGHLADGNLHLQILPYDKPSAGNEALIAQLHDEVNRMVFDPLVALGGSVSAEHGIGTAKKAYLSMCRTETEIAMMRQLKHSLDPKGVLNPGKIFD